MVNFGLIPWDYCKTILEMDHRDKELTELLIFSASAEIEIYTERNLFERKIREHNDDDLQKEIELHQYPVWIIPSGRRPGARKNCLSAAL